VGLIHLATAVVGVQAIRIPHGSKPSVFFMAADNARSSLQQARYALQCASDSNVCSQRPFLKSGPSVRPLKKEATLTTMFDGRIKRNGNGSRYTHAST
jgi:hypothetical protein